MKKIDPIRFKGLTPGPWIYCSGNRAIFGDCENADNDGDHPLIASVEYSNHVDIDCICALPDLLELVNAQSELIKDIAVYLNDINNLEGLDNSGKLLLGRLFKHFGE